MNKHLTSCWRSSVKNQSSGRHRRLSFFLWVRDRAIKRLQSQGGLALAASAALIPATVQGATLTVDTLSDTDADGQTLREAIALANGNGEDDTINFAPGLAGGTLTLTQGELSINAGLTIAGPTNPITISGNNLSRIFNILPSTVAISDLILTEGNGTGAAVNNAGGAILVRESILTLTNCEISENISDGNGGGIASQLAEVELVDCLLTNNQASNHGGGVRAEDVKLTLTNCVVSNNRSVKTNNDTLGALGGGIFANATSRNGSLLALTDCEVSGNSVTNFSTTGFGNRLRARGGGIYSENLDTVRISNSLLLGNSASGIGTRGIGGGIVSNNDGELAIQNSTVSDNDSVFFGGGISSESTDAVTIANSTISNNISNLAGGLGLYGVTEAILANTTLIENTARTSTGGGIYCSETDALQCHNCTITGNDSATAGSGIFATQSSLLLANSIVAFNSEPSLLTEDLVSPLELPAPNLFNAIDSAHLGGVTSQVIETNPANVFATTATVNGILTGTLANNGGPVSTILILQGGAAENAGLDSALPDDPLDLDQDGELAEALPIDARGLNRVTSGSLDLGAVEISPPALFICFDGLAADGSPMISFDLSQSLEAGETWILSRSADLVSPFEPIFVFDGTTVTLEELGNLSQLNATGTTYTITDTSTPFARAFYYLTIGPDPLSTP